MQELLKFLTTHQAAAHLNLSCSHLQNMRSQNRGPIYVKLGRKVVYPLEALQRYVENRTITTNES